MRKGRGRRTQRVMRTVPRLVGGVLVVGSGLALALAQGCPSSPDRGARILGPGERVFVVNSHGRSLSVIDHATHVLVDTIPLDARLHGQVPSPDGSRLYVTASGGTGEVIAVDTTTHTIDWRLRVGTSLHQPAVTRDGRRLFVPDFTRGVVAVVDLETRRVAREIALGGGEIAPPGPHNAYRGARGSHVYQTLMLGSALVRLNTVDGRIDRVYRLPGEPRPAALLADESRIYVQLTALHGLVEIDLETGRETRRIAWPLPGGEPTPPEPRCHGIGITPDGRELWATSKVDDALRVLKLPELAELGRVPLGGDPHWLAFSADGETGYLTIRTPNDRDGFVAVVDRRSRTVVATVPVGGAPTRMHTVLVPAAPPT